MDNLRIGETGDAIRTWDVKARNEVVDDMIYYKVMDELIYRVFSFTLCSGGIDRVSPLLGAAGGGGRRGEEGGFSSTASLRDREKEGTADGRAAGNQRIRSGEETRRRGGGGGKRRRAQLNRLLRWRDPSTARNNRMGWRRVISWKYSVIPGAVPFPRDKIRRTDFIRAG